MHSVDGRAAQHRRAPTPSTASAMPYAPRWTATAASAAAALRRSFSPRFVRGSCESERRSAHGAGVRAETLQASATVQHRACTTRTTLREVSCARPHVRRARGTKALLVVKQPAGARCPQPVLTPPRLFLRSRGGHSRRQGPPRGHLHGACSPHAAPAGAARPREKCSAPRVGLRSTVPQEREGIVIGVARDADADAMDAAGDA
jgi:hypothetical protein